MTLVNKIKFRACRSTLEKKGGKRVGLNESFLAARSTGTVRIGQLNADSMNAIANFFTFLSDDTMTLSWNDMNFTFVKNDYIDKEVNWLADHSKFVAEQYLINEKFDYMQTRETLWGLTYYVLTNAAGDICFAQAGGEDDIAEGYH